MIYNIIGIIYHWYIYFWGVWGALRPPRPRFLAVFWPFFWAIFAFPWPPLTPLMVSLTVNPARWKTLTGPMIFKIVFAGEIRSYWPFAFDGLKWKLDWNWNWLTIKMKFKIVFAGNFRSYWLFCIGWMSNLGHKRKKFVENALWEKNSKFPQKKLKDIFLRVKI